MYSMSSGITELQNNVGFGTDHDDAWEYIAMENDWLFEVPEDQIRLILEDE